MRPVAVVMLDVLVDYGSEVSTIEDEYPIEAFTPDRPDEAFSEGVGSRRPGRCSDDPGALGAEDLIEAGGEFRCLDRG